MAFSRVTSAAGSAASVGGAAASTAQSSLTTNSYMAMMQAQHQDTMASTLATAKMSMEEGLNNAMGKFLKSCGENVKGMAP
jgi:hypothetical protein